MSNHATQSRSKAEHKPASLHKLTLTRSTPAPQVSANRLQRAVADPCTARPADILALQGRYGNQAVQRLLSQHAVQAKLTVGVANDQYEQEADHVADQVTASRRPGQAAGHTLQRQPLANAITRLPAVQGKAEGALEATPRFEQRLGTAQGGGAPLPAPVRAVMEPRFGADFSGVRLHADTEAAQLNQSLGAKAFTHGADIYLGAGAEKPGTQAGDHLLAHELTHTLQQSGGARVQGWWPKGHRLITALAAKRGHTSKFYTQAAMDFLVDRSPDIDFIQDQTDTMNEGIKQSAPRLEMYENLIKRNEDTTARGMWDRNDLHMRRPEYMLSHGEGGRYKEPDASSKNEAMTSRLVDKAEALWQWNDQTTWARSLEVLSDALHQAEDRGSHGEGNAFSGHDVRLNLKAWLKQQKRPAKTWEELPANAPQDGWEPDNFDVNQKGGVLGVGFAVGVFGRFASDLGVKEARPIDLPGGKKTQPQKRKAKFKSWLPSVSSSNVATGIKGNTGGDAKKLEEIFDKTMKADGMEGAYGEATAAPTETHAPEEYRAEGGDLEKGMGFYEQGRPSLEQEGETQTAFMTRIFVEAQRKFKEWGKTGARFGRGQTRDFREKKVREYYDHERAKFAQDLEKQAIVDKAIQAAHTSVFGYPIPKII